MARKIAEGRTSMKRVWFAFFMILVLLLPTFEGVMAEDHVRVTQEQFLRVAKQLYPPGSNGKTADWCPLPTGYMMRQEIIQLLKQGLSEEEVIDTLAKKYGEQVLAAPAKNGFNLTLWVLPFIGVILGLVLLLFFLWRKYKASRHVITPSESEINIEESISDEDQNKIELELMKYLNNEFQTEFTSIHSLYRDLADLEYDYLLEKVNRADYTSMKISLYRQILAIQQEGRGK
jgi:cytochrome c-type biogenesis protein CcmH/NrfF